MGEGVPETSLASFLEAWRDSRATFVETCCGSEKEGFAVNIMKRLMLMILSCDSGQRLAVPMGVAVAEPQAQHAAEAIV